MADDSQPPRKSMSALRPSRHSIERNRSEGMLPGRFSMDARRARPSMASDGRRGRPSIATRFSSDSRKRPEVPLSESPPPPLPRLSIEKHRPEVPLSPTDDPAEPQFVEAQETQEPDGINAERTNSTRNASLAAGRSSTHLPRSSSATYSLDAPPSLNYTLKGRRRWIFFFWSLVLIDSIAMPLVLYFALWYATDLSHNAVFSISTAALGGVSIVEYFLRFWRLFKKGSTCRVIGARRWYLDWFHWNYSIAWMFIMVELIVGTVPKEPPIRLLAMPVASLLYWFSFQLLVQDFMRYFGFSVPLRISSVPKGAKFRPGIYSIIEDVLAVDGSGGTKFRKDFDRRFVASHDFRQMLHRLTAFWGFGAMAAAILTTILVFTIERDAAYVVGWTVPFIWAGIWTIGTIFYVKKCLRRERANWGMKKEEA